MVKLPSRNSSQTKNNLFYRILTESTFSNIFSFWDFFFKLGNHSNFETLISAGRKLLRIRLKCFDQPPNLNSRSLESNNHRLEHPNPPFLKVCDFRSQLEAEPVKAAIELQFLMAFIAK